MKKRGNVVTAASYASGIIIIATGFLLAVLLFMCAFGLIYPRREQITVRTESYSKIYDTLPISGGTPMLTYGDLHPGHTITTVRQTICSKVGVYVNEPEFIITDGSGADVTDMYEITTDYGEIVIEGRPITVYCDSKSKVYDGTPLYSDDIRMMATMTTLFEGHTFVCLGRTSLTMPGEVQIEPLYRIVDEFGADVTDQYKVTESLGTLTVSPIPLMIYTESGTKYYDGTPIDHGNYFFNQKLLEGHNVVVIPEGEYVEVGEYKNMATAEVLDQNGNNVSNLYDISCRAGTLTIKAIDLSVLTGSAEKIYDGTSLECNEWSITGGDLLPGDTLSAIPLVSLSTVGTLENKMKFTVTDENGKDVTSRYDIYQTAGTIKISPRQLTIRTGSASKVYDGRALSCEEYEMIIGTICEGESLELAFTSMTNIGYSENYIVSFKVYRTEKDGTQTDVTLCYGITYDYGTLTITAN